MRVWARGTRARAAAPQSAAAQEEEAGSALAAAGAAIGLLRSDLLIPWIIGGAAGVAAGAGIGYVYGQNGLG